MAAAGSAALDDQIAALSSALARGALEDAAADSELLFVRAIDDLDAAHVLVLRSFVMSSNELGLGDGWSAEFDDEVNSQRRSVDRAVVPQLNEVLPPIMALLVRHGLIGILTSADSMTYGGMSKPQRVSTCEIAVFGRYCLRRLGFGRR